MNDCPHCGAFVPEGATHCNECGKPLVDAPPSPTAPPVSTNATHSGRGSIAPETAPTSQAKPRGLTALVILLLLAGFYGLFVGYFPDLRYGQYLENERGVLAVPIYAGALCLLASAGVFWRTWWGRVAAIVVSAFAFCVALRLGLLSILYSSSRCRFPNPCPLPNNYLGLVFLAFGWFVAVQLDRGLSAAPARERTLPVQDRPARFAPPFGGARPIGVIIVTAMYAIYAGLLLFWYLTPQNHFILSPDFRGVLLASALFDVVVAWGLYSQHKWARDTAILLSWLGVFLCFAYVGLPWLPMNGVVLYFLLWNRETVSAFRQADW